MPLHDDAAAERGRFLVEPGDEGALLRSEHARDHRVAGTIEFA
jgi:hypothetical protein